MKFFFLLFVLLSLSCGDDEKAVQPTGRVDFTKYDQTCESDSDCALVRPVLCGCSCATAGINTSELAAFNATLATVSCQVTTDVCGDCVPMIAVCRDDMCGAKKTTAAE